MPKTRIGSVPKPNEVRFIMPKRLMEQFSKEPRVLIKWRPDGLWPVDPYLLRRIDWKKLATDREFNKNFEVVIMPKG